MDVAEQAAIALEEVCGALPGGGERRPGQEAMVRRVAESSEAGTHLVVRAGQIFFSSHGSRVGGNIDQNELLGLGFSSFRSKLMLKSMLNQINFFKEMSNFKTL